MTSFRYRAELRRREGTAAAYGFDPDEVRRDVEMGSTAHPRLLEVHRGAHSQDQEALLGDGAECSSWR